MSYRFEVLAIGNVAEYLLHPQALTSDDNHAFQRFNDSAGCGIHKFGGQVKLAHAVLLNYIPGCHSLKLPSYFLGRTGHELAVCPLLPQYVQSLLILRHQIQSSRSLGYPKVSTAYWVRRYDCSDQVVTL